MLFSVVVLVLCLSAHGNCSKQLKRQASPACNSEWCDPNHQPYPNIVAVMTGYNILRGNPFASRYTHDPGFSTGYIFVPTVRDQDKKYVMHSGITVRETRRCQLSLKTHSVGTAKGYRDQMIEKTSSGHEFATGTEKEISAELEGVGIKTTVPPLLDMAFSASDDYKENKEFFSKKRGVLTFNEATCSVYTVRISPFDPPNFTPAFVNAAKMLSNANTDTEQNIAFDRFIREFGTHFLQQTTMGARTAITRRYSQDEFKNANSNDISKCNAHRFKINLFAGPGGGSSNQECKSISNQAEDGQVAGTQREYITSYGSKPDTSLFKWANQKFSAPSPIKMQLSPILNLFTAYHWRNEKDVDYKKIIKWMGPRYYKYCEDYKRDLKLTSCTPQKNLCGIDDNCIPGQQVCNNNRYGGGFTCCSPPCKKSPCQNGGQCSDYTKGQCTFSCKCKKGYAGDRCQSHMVEKDMLLQEVRGNMRSHSYQSNDDYRNTLYNMLTKSYPDYYWQVAAYQPITGFQKHAVVGLRRVYVFREFNRNVIVSWTKKSSRLPSKDRADSIKNAIVAAISHKTCDAKESLEKAMAVINRYGYQVSMAMVVRFGNGLRNLGNSRPSRFVNFKCSGGESSFVIMFGE